jgi:hypothetical protein
MRVCIERSHRPDGVSSAVEHLGRAVSPQSSVYENKVLVKTLFTKQMDISR